RRHGRVDEIKEVDSGLALRHYSANHGIIHARQEGTSRPWIGGVPHLKHRLSRVALAVLPLAALTAPLATPHVALAAVTIVVDNTGDPLAAGDCGNSHPANTCTLRAAVLRANGETGDTIQLAAATYTLAQPDPNNVDNGSGGDLEVLSSMTIKGAGAGQTIVTGNTGWAERIFEIETVTGAPTTATISDMTITHGSAENDNGDSNDGGGILNDASILTVHNVVFDNNHAPFGSGGGLATNAGTTTVSNTTFTNNDANTNGGGLFVGGNITTVQSYSSLYFHDNSAIAGSESDNGGGAIYNDASGSGNAATTFTDLTIVNNHAPGMSGGGIYENSGLAAGKVTYTNLTIANNTALNSGGGIYVLNSRAIITNATITGNSVSNANVDIATVGHGGGIALGFSSSIVLNNNTINANTSPKSGAGLALLNSDENATLHNTIVHNNVGGGVDSNCFIRSGQSSAAITSTGYNLSNDTTCGLTGTGDRQGSTFNPNLGPLQDNNGPTDGAPGATSATLTEALPKGSIAIDTADPNAGNNPATDERHVTRPQGAASDVGAYEYIPPTPTLPLAGAGEAVGWRLEFTLLAILLATLVAVMLVTVGRLSRARVDKGEET
ncbi:MAG: choice-of-anchor Q domain-containing protein, partial [Candidatus Dormiibacterota bacterium]